MQPAVITIILLAILLLYMQLRLQARAIRRLSKSRRMGYVDDSSFLIWVAIIFFGGFIGALYYLKRSGD